MVAEVCLGKVGAVAAREVSRFARNSRDWPQSRCVVDTLLVDQETIYAPFCRPYSNEDASTQDHRLGVVWVIAETRVWRCLRLWEDGERTAWADCPQEHSAQAARGMAILASGLTRGLCRLARSEAIRKMLASNLPPATRRHAAGN
jgi:hypothetical protein